MARSSAIEQWLTWSFSPTISAILVTLLVSLTIPILIHLYLYHQASTKEPSSILLLGPSGAGKTSLLTLLSTGSALPTHTSQEPTTTFCQLPSSARTSEDRYRSENDTSNRNQPSFLVLDTPGHGKLRHHALSAITLSKSNLKGVVYVVDSAALSSASGLTEAAEYLHDVLVILQKRQTQGNTSKPPQAIPVLVAANKQDVFTSLPVGLVQRSLEEEIAKVRSTRSKGLMDSGIGREDGDGINVEADEEAGWLGEYGNKAFAFRQMEEHGIEVGVLGGSVKGEERPDEWWAWIGEQL